MLAIITQRQIKDAYGVDCDQLEKNYVTFFENLKVDLIPVSNFQKPLFHNAKLLILTGGGSINQEQIERDNVEKYLFDYSLKNNIPIIGICRGMQYINILLGGSISHLDNLHTQRKIRQCHEVKFKDRVIEVNNFHNDGIFKGELAQSLTPLAMDEENDVVEAFYSGKSKILGVQWHPEREFDDKKSQDFTKDLIMEFILNNGELNESRYISSR